MIHKRTEVVYLSMDYRRINNGYNLQSRMDVPLQSTVTVTV